MTLLRRGIDIVKSIRDDVGGFQRGG
jgi:hypothetical protein